MSYSEDEMLMLSGIQHYMFCPRQWALIHIEQQWGENRLTAEGELLHQNVDDPSYRQKNGDIITLHSLPIASKELGLYGISDAIELIHTSDGANAIHHEKYPGLWTPFPIEYKHGKPKSDERDEVQLAAQVICLEEMYNIHIDNGALFYGETRRRENIEITEKLRATTRRCAEEMHIIYNSCITPAAVKQPHCRNCSLTDLCLPELYKCSKVSFYLNNILNEETT